MDAETTALTAAEQGPPQPSGAVRVVRTVGATTEEVWCAWTEGDLVRRWWGPTGFTSPRADMDVRVGGTSVVTMQAPPEFGGTAIHNGWTYTAVHPPTRLEFTSTFTDQDGEVIDPADAGIPGPVPREVPHEVNMRDLGDGRTQVEVVESGYTDEQVRAMSQAGQEQCLDKLAALLDGQRGERHDQSREATS
jgi:uncharacterized protein YndB with AHSA1/START domain